MIVLLACSLNVSLGVLYSSVALVHAQSTFDYSLSNSGGITLVPGGSGFNTIIATLRSVSGEVVNLSCINATLPTGFSCSFNPLRLIPTLVGNASILTVNAPASATYGSFNISVTGTPTGTTTVPSNFTLIVAAKVAVNPTGTADTSLTPGQFITVALSTTDAIPFEVFAVAISYNPLILRDPQVDTSGNVLGSDAQVESICVNGATVPGGSVGCTSDSLYDGPHVVSVSVDSNTGMSTPTPDGKLFSVTFNVAALGFSTIHIVNQLLASAETTEQVVPSDGYFTNKDCGAGLCKPPIASFIPPTRLVANRPEIFNASAVSQNPQGRIRSYNWTWGLGTFYTTPFANATIIFSSIGEYFVTLGVTDNYNATAYYTLVLTVIRIWIDLGVVPVLVDHILGVMPGTTIHIETGVLNFGVGPENTTLRLQLNNATLATKQFQNVEPAIPTVLLFDWDTTNFAPRVYRIMASIDPVTDFTTNKIIENDTIVNSRGQIVDANSFSIAYVQLIPSIPSGFGLFLGLGLPQTLGLGIIVLAAIGIIQVLVRRKIGKSKVLPP